MAIKAIETVYNGYRFRSRLEARWAVFFDSLGIKYDYELQGFDLGEAGWYLPDFWLPEQKCFVEIKPRGNWSFNWKCNSLALQGDKILYICGNPWPGEYGIGYYYNFGNDEWGDRIPFCPSPHGFALGRKDEEELWVVCSDGCQYCLNSIVPIDRSKGALDSHENLLNAFKAARQARFEHGETPR